MRIPNLIKQKLLSRSKHQILKTNLHGKVRQLQGRINNQILEVKGLKKKKTECAAFQHFSPKSGILRQKKIKLQLSKAPLALI